MATLSPIIEYLFARSRPPGGRICHPRVQQFSIPILPPGITVSYTWGPPGIVTGVPPSFYAAINFKSNFGEDMIPGVIFLRVFQGGDMYLNGLLTPDLTRESLPSFLIFTQASPITVQLTNMSNVNQRFFGSEGMAAITSEEDYREIIRQLDSLTYSGTRELALDANNLLKQMVKALERWRR